MPPIIPPTASLIMLEYYFHITGTGAGHHTTRDGARSSLQSLYSRSLSRVTCDQCDTRAVVTISVTWTSEEGVTAVMSGGIVTEAAASHITPSHPRYEELIVVTLWRAASWHMTGGLWWRGALNYLKKIFLTQILHFNGFSFNSHLLQYEENQPSPPQLKYRK